MVWVLPSLQEAKKLAPLGGWDPEDNVMQTTDATIGHGPDWEI
jgi:hypothetical protein